MDLVQQMFGYQQLNFATALFNSTLLAFSANRSVQSVS